MEDRMISFGGAIKALGDGRTEGYLIRWGSPDDRDLENEYFTPDTFLGHTKGAGAIAMVHHGIPMAPEYAKIASQPLKNPIEVEVDDVGVIARHLLDIADAYEEMVYGLAEKGKFGFSSGAIPYAVDIDKETGEIKRWVITEASYTPSPAEPRNRVMALKAYMDSLDPKDSEPKGVSAPVPVVDEATKSAVVKKEARDMKRFPLGSGYGVYKVDDEGKKMGDPVEIFTSAESADTWIAESKKEPWEKAIDRLGEKMSQVLVASRPDPERGAGMTGEPAQVRKDVTWKEYVIALYTKNKEHLDNMGSKWVKLKNVDPDMAKALSESTGPAGGFTVPNILRPDIIRFEGEDLLIWPRARRQGMESRTESWPAVATSGSTAGRSNFYGGFYPQWNEHGSEKPETEPSFAQIKLETHEMSAYTEIEEMLIMHSIMNMIEFVRDNGREAIMFYTDESFLDGNGVGQPLGIINAGATLTVNRAGAGAFAYADAVNMIASMLPRSRRNMIWVMHDTVIPQLLTMVDPNGNYVWQPNARDGFNHPLFGAPIYFTEKSVTLGTAGDVMLIDPKYYYIGQNGDVIMAMSEDYKFRDNLVALKIVIYVDGQPCLSDPIYLKDGTSQRSPFVILGDVAT